MANKYISTRAFPISLIVAIVGVVIVGVILTANFIFFSNSGSPNDQPINVQEALLNASDDRSVLMTVRGPIVSDEEYRTYQIRISPTERTLAVYGGYQEEQIDVIALNNTTLAYEQFVYALNDANYMSGSSVSGATNDDLRGVCATGKLYVFHVLQSGTQLKSLWTSSCSSAKGTLSARLNQITKLFMAQIPDSEGTISKIWQ